jgi:poly(3-hydroxybutyrate) depolymerase
MLNRRQLLAATLGAALVEPAIARAASKHYEIRDLVVPGSPRIGERLTLLIPKHTKERVPLLVLLHGLGETHDQKLGARAWIDRYGLASSYDRLHEPPIQALAKSHRHWTVKRLAEVNALLDQQAMRGLAIACPYTPNVYKARSRGRMLDEYADWIVDTVIPCARKEAHVYGDARRTYLDGCSLGGYVGIEVFLRKTKHFGAWGTLQGALGAHRIAGYAKRVKEQLDRYGTRHIHVETSSGDAFRKINQRFSRQLSNAGVAHDFIMPPGPHNQPFLRDSGTLEMLLWYDRLPR